MHIEPQESFIRVRFRRDGILYDRFTMMLAMKKPISVRAKVVGSMDIAESRLPQDGSYSETVDGVSYDFRISTLPSLYGETIVIRILSGKVDFIENNHLGMMDVQEKLFMKCLRRKAGMILTTGPTGSGKTSTLYAALRLLNDPSVNIISIEDPVEYRIEGVTQIQVNKKAGLTFEKGLRSIVRQDPDILMVGEIRDRETAEIAVHAALTGHLVLSTLHTVNAASAPLRLMDMGIAPYLLADSLSLIISQRIPGRLCPHCKRKVTLTEEKFADLSLPKEFLGETVMDAEGCAGPARYGRGGASRAPERLDFSKISLPGHRGRGLSKLDIEKLMQTYPNLTDVHATQDEPLMIRAGGALKKLRETAGEDFFTALFTSYVNEDRMNAYKKEGALDTAFSLGNTRFRLHIYKSGGKPAAAIRVLPELSALPADPDHIVTLEDPVEYVISSDKALVHQREIGEDTPSFAEGVIESLREDPDIIAVGEMRDAATIEAALTAAETGHLVFATLHTTRAKDACTRIIHAFPSTRENEIRSILSSCLQHVLTQRLCRPGKETFLMREILTNVPAVSHLIREGKDEQIPSYMEMGLQNMRTLKQAAYGLKNISEKDREKLLKTLE